MRVSRWTFITVMAALACFAAPGLLARNSDKTRLRWDIFNPKLGTTPLTIAPGGHSISQVIEA